MLSLQNYKKTLNKVVLRKNQLEELMFTFTCHAKRGI